MLMILIYPPHLTNVATLPCESQNSSNTENARECKFNKMTLKSKMHKIMMTIYKNLCPII